MIELDAPPSEEVDWMVTALVPVPFPTQQIFVPAQTWFGARQKGAAAFGLEVDQIEVRMMKSGHK